MVCIMLRSYKLILILIFLLIGVSPESGETLPASEQSKDQIRQIFSKVEEGISSGQPGRFSYALGSQTYISLSTGSSGYYSSGQAFYILQDYFNICRPLGFRFNMIDDKTDNPYASGTYRYESRGTTGTSQIFVTLKQFGNSWKISQITIN